MSEPQAAPMRTQIKANDGTPEGVWLTVFEGWLDLEKSGMASDESANLARSIASEQEDQS